MDDAAPLAKTDARGDLYERDFHAWGLQQAALLRAGRLGEADIENIAEEIESLSRSEKRELVSRLTVLLLHLLKWRYQASLRGASWEASVKVQRIRLTKHLDENPSLRPRVEEAMVDAYEIARLQAAGETELSIAAFPDTCPWSFDQMVDDAFWPD